MPVRFRRAEGLGHHHHAQRGGPHRRGHRQRLLGRRDHRRRLGQHRRHRRHRAGEGRPRRVTRLDRLGRPEELRAPAWPRNDWIFSLDADERDHAGAGRRDPRAARDRAAARRLSRAARHVSTSDAGSARPTSIPTTRPASTTAASARWSGTVRARVGDGRRRPGQLVNELQHYSFRDLRDQLDRINRYTTLAARQMYERGRRAGPLAIVVHPPAAFLRNYILRRGFLDGTVGSHDLDDERVFGVPEVRQALGAAEQLPTPNFQIPTTSN